MVEGHRICPSDYALRSIWGLCFPRQWIKCKQFSKLDVQVSRARVRHKGPHDAGP
ncbi:hypothetical protein SZ54_1627 [Rhizobium sp. UR51a]|nr:hypothetical protein SZ54_1627 [Rhizobium sp. UR51a]